MADTSPADSAAADSALHFQDGVKSSFVVGMLIFALALTYFLSTKKLAKVLMSFVRCAMCKGHEEAQSSSSFSLS